MKALPFKGRVGWGWCHPTLRHCTASVSSKTATSERNLRPQLGDFRIQRDSALVAECTDVVRLQLEVLAEVPVHAERPVVLLATGDDAVVQIERGIAQPEFDRAVVVLRFDVAEGAALVRAGFSGDDPAAVQIRAV